MDEQPTGHYPLDRGTAARDSGPASHAVRRGAPPRHAAGAREGWYTTVGPEPDPVYSPLAGSPEPLEYEEADPGIPDPRPWYPRDDDAPEQRLPRRVPPALRRRPRRRFPRWLPVAGAGVIVLIVAVAVVIAHGGTPAAQLAGRGTAAGAGNGSAAPGTGLQPVITRKAAQQVLARFTSVNNEANKQYDNTLLATIEGGSSYVMDTGTYRMARVTDPKASQYAPFGPQQAVYYIPRQPAGAYPHFFVVKVANADLASPQHVTFTQYLLFAQAAPGGPWKDVIEPNVFSAARPAPAIAVDAQGYAQQVSVTGNPGGLSTAPAKIQADTISWLDREAAAGADPANAGSLADLRDVIFWRDHLPSGTVTDTHVAGPGPAFGLRTAGGGAIFFYSLTARLELTAPPGDTFRVEIPGYYSSSQTLQSAAVGYIEQFAAFDPPRGNGSPRVVADYSSIAERG